MDTNKIILGDCIEVMKTLPDNSVDSCVTDPPYGIGFMGKEWDNFKPKEIKKTTKLVYKTDYINGVPVKRKKPEIVTRDSGARVAGTYDLSFTGNQKFQEWYYQVMKECFRVLKPGGHLLSFGGTRTYHRMAVAIEDAGFEVRDMIEWIYGSGFPKSLNIGKSIDSKLTTGSAAKNEFHKLEGERRDGRIGMYDTVEEQGFRKVNPDQLGAFNHKPTTNEAKEWEGWGTALKPAHEPICMARKPLAEKTVAENCLKWGTGGINIDESRVESGEEVLGRKEGTPTENVYDLGINKKKENRFIDNSTGIGRFPANLIHDNSEEVRECFPDDSARFFKSILYYPKASKSERNKGCEELEDKLGGSLEGGNDKRNGDKPQLKPTKNNHPTVKPIALMEYLISMVTPKGGIVLDPFTGSGSTLIAAKKNGFQYIGIEKEAEYVKIAEARLSATRVDNKLF